MYIGPLQHGWGTSDIDSLDGELRFAAPRDNHAIQMTTLMDDLMHDVQSICLLRNLLSPGLWYYQRS